MGSNIFDLNLNQFSSDEIEYIKKLSFNKIDKKGNEVRYIKCLARQKDVVLKPEEIIRQLYIYKLHSKYDYPYSKMEVEYPVSFGREKKRADIAIFNKAGETAPYIIVELKSPKLKDRKEQLKSYCNATGAPIGIWTNGEQFSFYHRKDPNLFEDIPDIPTYN